MSTRTRFALMAALCAVFTAATLGPASAIIISRKCGGCHTIHNSEGNQKVAKTGCTALRKQNTDFADAQPHLLKYDCLGCHSNGEGALTQNVGGQITPVVYNWGRKPSNDIGLAGGNFYWVVYGGEGGEVRDRYGHNVCGISSSDTILVGKYTDVDYYSSKGADSPSFCPTCFTCHSNLSRPAADDNEGNMKGHPCGCQGCHCYPKHHRDTDAYRMLRSHAPTPEGGVDADKNNYLAANCVWGYEDPDWEGKDLSSAKHNEYAGSPVDPTNPTATGRLSATHSITAFCVGCHVLAGGDPFYGLSKVNNGFLRHPADMAIPSRGEFTALDAESYHYNPEVPVARDYAAAGGPGYTFAEYIKEWGGGEPISVVYTEFDLVMCLTCHRAHGSKYPHMLRWEYDDSQAPGEGGAASNCLYCHTEKAGDYGES
ncbi:MAG: cytochrome c3 family protein [Pseudomonadota bacterium]